MDRTGTAPEALERRKMRKEENEAPNSLKQSNRVVPTSASRFQQSVTTRTNTHLYKVIDARSERNCPRKKQLRTNRQAEGDYPKVGSRGESGSRHQEGESAL
jgi:hypothetical protein